MKRKSTVQYFIRTHSATFSDGTKYVAAHAGKIWFISNAGERTKAHHTTLADCMAHVRAGVWEKIDLPDSVLFNTTR